MIEAWAGQEGHPPTRTHHGLKSAVLLSLLIPYGIFAGPAELIEEMNPRLLAALIAILGVASQDNVNPACEMPLSARRDAWDGVFPIGECEQMGYCWMAAPRHLPNVPWCFHRAPVEGHAAPEACAAAAAGMRRECADGGGVTPRSCAMKGCCWASGRDGDPWCFWPAGEGYSDEQERSASQDAAAADEAMHSVHSDGGSASSEL
jgi:hypothetical protein